MAVGFDEDVLDFLVTKRIFDSIALAGHESGPAALESAGGGIR
jgi:hypothetical protein